MCIRDRHSTAHTHVVHSKYISHFVMSPFISCFVLYPCIPSMSIGFVVFFLKIVSRYFSKISQFTRATRKGQWSTNPEHLPDNYKGFTQWSMVALKEQDYDKYARKMKKYLKWELIILDDFLLHTITDVFLATPSGITIDLFLKRFIIPLAHSFFL